MPEDDSGRAPRSASKQQAVAPSAEPSQAKWEAVIDAKRALLPGADKEAGFNLYCELAEIYDEKLQKYDEAIEAYEAAFKIKPDSPRHKLMLVLSRTEPKWEESIKVLGKIAATENDSLRRGKFYYTAGVIYRDGLKFTDEAIAQFNLALDAYFENPDRIPRDRDQFEACLKPLEAIDMLCTARKDWKTQAQNYRRMIERMPKVGREQAVAALFRTLGEIYRSRLGDVKAASDAFEAALRLEPPGSG